MDERDLNTVAAAFDRLMALATKYTDPATLWTIAAVKDDIIDILAGTWTGDAVEDAPAALQLDDAFAF